MSLKSFFRSKSFLFVVWNVLAAILIIIVLLIGLYFWLRRYTQHGHEVDVPNVVGLYMEEAVPQAQAQGMTIQITDSTYSNRVPLGTIVEQTPPANSHAKQGRVLYVVVNARCRRQVPLPDLQDMSYRQAEATLRSLGIVVNPDYEYEPSEYKDLILAVKKNGEVLTPGQRIEEGSRVTLVIGFGKGTEQVRVPNVIGLSLQDARSLLLGSRLTVGATEYDALAASENGTDEELTQIVYIQSPAAGEYLLEGSHVDLKLSSDVEKSLNTQSASSEEDFF